MLEKVMLLPSMRLVKAYRVPGITEAAVEYRLTDTNVVLCLFSGQRGRNNLQV